MDQPIEALNPWLVVRGSWPATRGSGLGARGSWLALAGCRPLTARFTHRISSR